MLDPTAKLPPWASLPSHSPRLRDSRCRPSPAGHGNWLPSTSPDFSKAHIQKTRIFKSSQTELLEAAWWTVHGSKHIKNHTKLWDEHPFTNCFDSQRPALCLKNPLGPLRWSAARSYDGIRWWCSAQLRPARPSPGRGNQKRWGNRAIEPKRVGWCWKIGYPQNKLGSPSQLHWISLNNFGVSPFKKDMYSCQISSFLGNIFQQKHGDTRIVKQKNALRIEWGASSKS